DKGRMRLRAWYPRLRKLAVVGGTLGGLVFLALFALWWRLSSGPIELDIATPWLTAAIKENFGPGHEVEIGGTEVERDANKRRTSLRIRDIVVRDADGTVVASAPKAEVGISGAGLLAGRIRAERLSLVGAEMAVRIESDSKVTVFAGSNKRPLVTASAASAPAASQPIHSPAKADRAAAAATPEPAASAAPLAPAAPATGRSSVPDLAALIAWIESLDASGLDGRDLTEIGLEGGNLTVDDQRNGKQWTFTNIDLSVTRPKGGGIAVALGSHSLERPWHLRAAMTPSKQGNRIIDIETQKLSTKDMMLAMRLSVDQYEADLPLSGRIRADVGPDGIRICSTGASWWRRASSSISTIRWCAFRSIAPRAVSIGIRTGARWSRRSRSSPGVRASRCWRSSIRRATAAASGACKSPPAARCGLPRRSIPTRWSSTASCCSCGSISPSSASISTRAKSATRISASRSPAAWISPATIRGSRSDLRARACPLRP